MFHTAPHSLVPCDTIEPASPPGWVEAPSPPLPQGRAGDQFFGGDTSAITRVEATVALTGPENRPLPCRGRIWAGADRDTPVDRAAATPGGKSEPLGQFRRSVVVGVQVVQSAVPGNTAGGSTALERCTSSSMLPLRGPCAAIPGHPYPRSPPSPVSATPHPLNDRFSLSPLTFQDPRTPTTQKVQI